MAPHHDKALPHGEARLVNALGSRRDESRERARRVPRRRNEGMASPAARPSTRCPLRGLREPVERNPVPVVVTDDEYRAVLKYRAGSAGGSKLPSCSRTRRDTAAGLCAVRDRGAPARPVDGSSSARFRGGMTSRCTGVSPSGAAVRQQIVAQRPTHSTRRDPIRRIAAGQRAGGSSNMASSSWMLSAWFITALAANWWRVSGRAGGGVHSPRPHAPVRGPGCGAFRAVRGWPRGSRLHVDTAWIPRLYAPWPPFSSSATRSSRHSLRQPSTSRRAPPGPVSAASWTNATPMFITKMRSLSSTPSGSPLEPDPQHFHDV